jgi:DNA-binding MarR family transcriptional regulator
MESIHGLLFIPIIVLHYSKTYEEGVTQMVNRNNPASDAFGLFFKTAVLVEKYADAVFYRRAGISTIKYTVLQILEAAQGPVTPSQISRKTLKVRHDITTLIRRMKRDGLVDVVPSETDKRSVNIMLTKKGREKLIQAEPVAEEIVNQVMSKVGKTNLPSMIKALNELNRNAYQGLDSLKDSLNVAL